MEITTDWTKREFKAYLLAYAANSNFFESEEESECIHKLVSDSQYNAIHRELSKDNDYQSIQKIMYNLKKYNYTKDQIHDLVNDIQEMFMADGEFDLLESNFLMMLKRIID